VHLVGFYCKNKQYFPFILNQHKICTRAYTLVIIDTLMVLMGQQVAFTQKYKGNQRRFLQTQNVFLISRIYMAK